MGGVVNTFEQWRIKLQRDLENISNDDSESDRASSVAQEVGEVTLRWKSFEEEKVELLQQLERSRLKEILRLQEELKKREERLSLGRIRAEKQRHLLLAQIENLKEAIPRAQESGRQRHQNLKEDITQISVLIDNCRAEAELLDNLRSHQVENEFTGEVVKEKKEVTDQLCLLQARQREELEALKREKYCEVDLGEVAGEREVAKIVAKIQVLEQELEGLEAEKVRKEARHKEMMVDLKVELERAERQRVISKKEEDEDQFACPVCMELLIPPLRIFQVKMTKLPSFSLNQFYECVLSRFELCASAHPNNFPSQLAAIQLQILQLNPFLCLYNLSSSSVPRGSHPLRELQGEPLPGALPTVPGSIGDQLQQEPSP